VSRLSRQLASIGKARQIASAVGVCWRTAAALIFPAVILMARIVILWLDFAVPFPTKLLQAPTHVHGERNSVNAKLVGTSGNEVMSIGVQTEVRRQPPRLVPGRALR